MKRTLYIRATGDPWSKPHINHTEVDFEVDFGKLVFGRSLVDTHELIDSQLRDLKAFDKRTFDEQSLKNNIEILEEHTKKLSDQVDTLVDKVDDLEAEHSDAQDEISDLEQDVEKLEFKIKYLQKVTYE